MVRHPFVIFFPGEYNQESDGGSFLRLFGKKSVSKSPKMVRKQSETIRNHPKRPENGFKRSETIRNAQKRSKNETKTI